MLRQLFAIIIILAAGSLNMMSALADDAKHRQLPVGLDNALKILHNDLKHRQQYLDQRQATIDKLKHQLLEANKVDSVYLYEELARAFDGYQMDSCVRYYGDGAELARVADLPVVEQRMRFQRYSRLPILGVIPEAIEGFESMRGKAYKENKADFFDAAFRMCSHVAALYPESNMRDRYYKAAHALADSILKYTPQNEVFRRLYAQAILCRERRDTTGFVAALQEIVDNAPVNDNIFARAASFISFYYSNRGDTERSAYYDALASISDIRAANLEGYALLHLGSMLFDMGDLDNAYDLLNISLSQSVKSGSKIRALEIGLVLPKVQQTLDYREHQHFVELNIFISVLLIVILALGIIMWIKLRHIKKMKSVQDFLIDSNSRREENIARFVELTSGYADQFDEFIRLVRRKLAAGQIEDLRTIIKSDTLSRKQTHMFAELFDNAFLHVYPTFVDEVNKLFLADKRISQVPVGSLNPELRIMAFERLGVTDSNRIGRFLGISVNTVYTYRNRTRSRAIFRESFEDDLQKIAQIKQ